MVRMDYLYKIKYCILYILIRRRKTIAGSPDGLARNRCYAVGFGGKQTEGMQNRSAGKLSQRTVLADVTHQFVPHMETHDSRPGESARSSARGQGKVSGAGVERQAAANLRRMR